MGMESGRRSASLNHGSGKLSLFLGRKACLCFSLAFGDTQFTHSLRGASEAGRCCLLVGLTVRGYAAVHQTPRT